MHMAYGRLDGIRMDGWFQLIRVQNPPHLFFRQTAMFSATWDEGVQGLAREFTTNATMLIVNKAQRNVLPMSTLSPT